MISRRSALTGVVVGGGALASPAQALRVGSLRVAQLKTASQTNPIGIGDRQPMLSWRLDGPPGTLQRACQIRVASDPARLRSGGPDLWDSGRVENSCSTGMRYAGKALGSRQRCCWQVRVWDEAGRTSAWSEPGFWEMGLLADEDWGGEWLAVESPLERDDRQAEPCWATIEAVGENVPGRFRLKFRSTKGDGQLVIHTGSRLVGLDLDGLPLPIPGWDPAAYGGPPAARFPLPLSEGEHVLTASVAARTSGGKASAAIAAQLRYPDATGALRRLVKGWEGLGADGAWTPAQLENREAPFPWPPTPARLFRRSFHLANKPAQTRLYVTALGGYRVWINGTRVGDDELQSEPAEYRRHVPYRTYDITPLLRAGENVVGMIVGDGFYASYQAPDGRYAYGPAPRRFRLMVSLLGDDATSIVTDERWRHCRSAIIMSEIYAGEDHDRRLWPSGWSEPGFDDRNWDEAWPAPAPAARPVASIAPPIRATRTVRPLSIRRDGPATHIVDFGQNFAGRVRLNVKGTRSQQVTVRHAEILSADGKLDRRNLRVARAEDRYVLAGGSETLEPLFTFQGFRYAQIDGLEQLDAGMIEGVVISSDLPEIGFFSTSQPMVQKLWLNTLWSQRSNFRGNPTDCPQRDERLGWTGDAQVFWDTAAFNMDVGGFTRSFTRILREDESLYGTYPMWSPSPKGLGWGSTTPTPGWADAGVMLPYVAYLHTGDAAVIDDNWSAMTKYCGGILSNNADGLWREGRGADLGDWLALDAKWPGDETTPKTLIATAMLTRSLDQMAAMATWTGRSKEAAHWRERAAISRAAFARSFVGVNGVVGNGSHTSYILALRLGLVPAGLRTAAGRLLAADIRRRGILLTTGFLGTPLALDALVDVGQSALAFDLLLRTEYPSWGYMVRHGGTTTWERWNSDVGDPSMNSFNHYAFGAVCSFLYRRLGGVEPIEPGFRKFRVQPVFDPRFSTAGVSLESPSGPIRFNWRRAGDRVTADLVVPANAVAEVILPGARTRCGSGRHSLSSKA